jgi:hypothetical protein
MRNLALSVAAILVLAVASPVFAQPFADVPTDHWAFDAIAELAAKGIIEGFPDGTFKGDRGVSRYEVAIIVARILARIEAIKIPAPAPAAAPQVTRTDVQTIQRLVNEFRAELAALGVRTTAVEEELTALKARTSAAKVTGDARLRYHLYPSGSPSSATGFASANFRNRVTVTGAVAPTAKLVVRARYYQNPLQSPQTTTIGFTSAVFDRTYFDLSGPFGLNWRVGQFDYTLGAGVGWSGYGLLADPSNAGVSFPGAGGIATNPMGYIDGVRVGGSLAGFNYELGGWVVDRTAGFNIYTARLEAGGLMPGWTIGASGLYQARNTAYPLPTAIAGTTSGTLGAAVNPNSNDTGFSVDLKGDLMPGLTLGATYATFSPTGSASSNAYAGWAVWQGLGLGTVTAWYKNYGSTTSGLFIPYWTGATTEADSPAFLAWNFVGYGAALDMNLSSNLSASVSYESGNQTVGNAAVTEYYGKLQYALAANTTISLNYWKATMAGADYDNFYRIELLTSF